MNEPTDDQDAINTLMFRMPHGFAEYGRFAVHAYDILRKRQQTVLEAFSGAISLAEWAFGYYDPENSDSGGEPLNGNDERCDDPECELCNQDGANVREAAARATGITSGHQEKPGVPPGQPQGNRRQKMVTEHIIGIDGYGANRRPATADERKVGIGAMYNVAPLRIQMASQLMLMAMREKLHDAGAWADRMPAYEEASEFAINASNDFVEKLVVGTNGTSG